MKSWDAFNATDVIPCEPVGTEDRLGTAYVGDELAAKSVRHFNKTALDHVLSHDGICDILGSGRRRLWREEITEWETEQRAGNTDFFLKNAWLGESPTCCVMYAFSLCTKSYETLRKEFLSLESNFQSSSKIMSNNYLSKYMFMYCN